MRSNSQIMPRILNIKEVSRYVDLSRATIYRLMRKDMFPKPLKLSLNRVGWILDDVDKWLNAKRTQQ